MDENNRHLGSSGSDPSIPSDGTVDWHSVFLAALAIFPDPASDRIVSQLAANAQVASPVNAAVHEFMHGRESLEHIGEIAKYWLFDVDHPALDLLEFCSYYARMVFGTELLTSSTAAQRFSLELHNLWIRFHSNHRAFAQLLDQYASYSSLSAHSAKALIVSYSDEDASGQHPSGNWVDLCAYFMEAHPFTFFAFCREILRLNLRVDVLRTWLSYFC